MLFPPQLSPRLAMRHLTGRVVAQVMGTVSAAATAVAIAPHLPLAPAAIAQQTPPRQPITLLSDVQEANAQTGVVTARGNVQIFYPARDMQATSAQAQYYSREGRIVLNGDVYVLQDGNSIQGETITYLVNEGRFLAVPETGEQVQSVYLIPGAEGDGGTVPATTDDFNPKPEFKDPVATP